MRSRQMQAEVTSLQVGRWGALVNAGCPLLAGLVHGSCQWQCKATETYVRRVLRATDCSC